MTAVVAVTSSVFIPVTDRASPRSQLVTADISGGEKLCVLRERTQGTTVMISSSSEEMRTTSLSDESARIRW
jgi:hypothetical protein